MEKRKVPTSSSKGSARQAGEGGKKRSSSGEERKKTWVQMLDMKKGKERL